MKSILSIAGFDPSSGAGTTRDVDTFFSLGIHGLSVPSCTVLQGPKGVQNLYATPMGQFRGMLGMVGKEIPFHGVKIGAVADDAHVKAIAALLITKKEVPVVIDPVLAAKNGVSLLTDKGLEALVEWLFPLATVITPNAEEASRICGMPVKKLGDMKKAAQSLFELGPAAVIIKGGHLKGDPVDLFFDGKEFLSWEKRRIDRVVHGTGCSFSSLMVTYLVLGYDLRDAFYATQMRMEEIFGSSYRIDKDGYFYMSTGIMKSGAAERWNVIEAMEKAKERLLILNPAELIPEVQMNIAYAVEGARGIEDVAAFPGRIGRHGSAIRITGNPLFGASSHVAGFILALMHRYPRIRSCANIRYNEAVIAKARKTGMEVVSFDRSKENRASPNTDESTPDFPSRRILGRLKAPPDIIYDKGALGKEPMIRLFAVNPDELINKMEMIRL